MNRDELFRVIDMVQGIASTANLQLLERAAGVRYLWREISTIMEIDLEKAPEAVTNRLSGIVGLLDAVAGSLDALASDMEICDRGLCGILNKMNKAA